MEEQLKEYVGAAVKSTSAGRRCTSTAYLRLRRNVGISKSSLPYVDGGVADFGSLDGFNSAPTLTDSLGRNIDGDAGSELE